MNYEFGYSMLFHKIIGFVAEFCGKVARSVYVMYAARYLLNENIMLIFNMHMCADARMLHNA